MKHNHKVGMWEAFRRLLMNWGVRMKPLGAATASNNGVVDLDSLREGSGVQFEVFFGKRHIGGNL